MPMVAATKVQAHAARAMGVSCLPVSLSSRAPGTIWRPRAARESTCPAAPSAVPAVGLPGGRSNLAPDFVPDRRTEAFRSATCSRAGVRRVAALPSGVVRRGTYDPS